MMTLTIKASRGFGHPAGYGSTIAVCLLGTTLFACSAKTAFAQLGSPRLVDHSPAQLVISKNQLLTPDRALRATELAREELIRGRIESAQKQIARALDIAPHCALALAIQGAIKVQTGHLDEAASSFQNAINNDPNLGAAYLGLGMIFSAQGHFKDALTPLDRAAALLPNAWIAYFQTGMAHLGLGDTERALEQANLADRFTTTDRTGESEVSLLRALIQLRLQDFPRARGYLTQTIDLDPDGPYAQVARREIDRLQSLLTTPR